VEEVSDAANHKLHVSLRNERNYLVPEKAVDDFVAIVHEFPVLDKPGACVEDHQHNQVTQNQKQTADVYNEVI
jgi:hypothetical protein